MQISNLSFFYFLLFLLTNESREEFPLLIDNFLADSHTKVPGMNSGRKESRVKCREITIVEITCILLEIMAIGLRVSSLCLKKKPKPSNYGAS